MSAPLISPADAVNLLADTLTIHPTRAQQLLDGSGITPMRMPGSLFLAYSQTAVRSLAQLGARHGVPVGQGPAIGTEADLSYYLDERNDQ